jgi:hypothetical protein
MSEPKHISEILKDYFLNSNEPLAVAYREHFAKGYCPFCPKCPQQTDLSDWLDNQDVMQVLHISPRTLQTLRSSGILPFSKIGNKIYYRRQDIIKILSDNYTLNKIQSYENQ